MNTAHTGSNTQPLGLSRIGSSFQETTTTSIFYLRDLNNLLIYLSSAVDFNIHHSLMFNPEDKLLNYDTNSLLDFTKH